MFKTTLKSLTLAFLLALPQLAAAENVYALTYANGVYTDSQGITYTLSGTSATVSDDTYLTATEIVIPEKVSYNGTEYTVTAIASSAFSGNTNITSVTIGANVTSIGERAFYNCTGITSITVNADYISYESSSTGSWLLDWVVSIIRVIFNISTDAFAGVTDVTLYVPFSWNETFKTADGWSTLIDNGAKVVRTLDIGSAGYATLYSSHNVTIPTGVTASVGTSTTTTELTCTELSGVIPAETGVILYAANISETTTFYFPETDTDSSATSILDGTLEDKETSSVTSGTVYTLAKENNVVGFYKYTGTTLGANKAYLVLSEEEAAKGFSIVFNDDETTSIEAVTTTVKATNGAIYNLQGQRVTTPTKGGVYIQNGKKFIAK